MAIKTHPIKEIINSETKWAHFILFLSIAVVLSIFIYILGIPLIYFFMYGSGEGAGSVSDLPLSTFIFEWGSLLIVLAISALGFFRHSHKQDASRAKSYLLAAVIVTILYLLRKPILDVAFDFFH